MKALLRAARLVVPGSALILAVAACGVADSRAAEGGEPAVDAAVDAANLAKATFAGGCFWCMEPPFDKLEGVVSTTSGYIGGQLANPTYQQVSAGGSGHTEAVEVLYDPDTINYGELLAVFWRNIDPLVANRQFCDWGSQYRTGIFYHDEQQQQLAGDSLAELEASKRFDRPIVTEIQPATRFYVAEEYHQDYYRKKSAHYKRYRKGCGRDKRLEELWGEGP